MHVVIALVIQAIVAALCGQWWLGAAAGSGYFVGREYAQAEYRLIAAHYGGHRIDMPWWGGVDARAWNAKSLIDWIAPTVVVCAVAFWRG